MKLTTEVCVALESKGRPQFTRKFNGPIRDVVLEFGRWIQECHMGSYIQITMARNERDLNAATSRAPAKTAQSEGMMDDLMILMNQPELPIDQHPDSE